MLEKEIPEALTKALKSGDKLRVSVLRLLISEIKNKRIADIVKQLEDDKIVGLMQKMARKYKESIDQFQKGGRQDLVDKESAELAILQEYMPKEMPEAELAGIVDKAVKELNATSIKDMGNVIKYVLGQVKGSADGSIVSRIVKEKLTRT